MGPVWSAAQLNEAVHVHVKVPPHEESVADPASLARHRSRCHAVKWQLISAAEIKSENITDEMRECETSSSIYTSSI